VTDQTSKGILLFFFLLSLFEWVANIHTAVFIVTTKVPRYDDKEKTWHEMVQSEFFKKKFIKHLVSRLNQFPTEVVASGARR
jgi:hypothetical protein